MPTKVRLGFLSLCMFSVLAAACIPLPTVDEEAEERDRPLQNVTLEMSAGPIGDRLLVSNHSNEPWESIVMVVNKDDGGGSLLSG